MTIPYPPNTVERNGYARGVRSAGLQVVKIKKTKYLARMASKSAQRTWPKERGQSSSYTKGTGISLEVKGKLPISLAKLRNRYLRLCHSSSARCASRLAGGRGTAKHPVSTILISTDKKPLKLWENGHCWASIDTRRSTPRRSGDTPHDTLQSSPPCRVAPEQRR